MSDDGSVVQRFEDEGITTDLCVNASSSVLDEINCSICLRIMRDPVSICKQQHYYCHECLETSIKKKPKCPSCRAVAERTSQGAIAYIPCRPLRNIIDKLEVYCYTNVERDEFMKEVVGKKRSITSITCCQWKGKLSDLPKHLEEECEYVDRVKELTESVKRLKRNHKQELEEVKQQAKREVSQAKREVLHEKESYRILSLENRENKSNLKSALEYNKVTKKLLETERKKNREENNKLKEQLNDFVYNDVSGSSIPTAHIYSNWKIVKVPKKVEGERFTVTDDKDQKYIVTYPNAIPGQQLAVKMPCEMSDDDVTSELQVDEDVIKRLQCELEKRNCEHERILSRARAYEESKWNMIYHGT